MFPLSEEHGHLETPSPNVFLLGGWVVWRAEDEDLTVQHACWFPAACHGPGVHIQAEIHPAGAWQRPRAFPGSFCSCGLTAVKVLAPLFWHELYLTGEPRCAVFTLCWRTGNTLLLSLGFLCHWVDDPDPVLISGGVFLKTAVFTASREILLFWLLGK